MAAVRRGPLGSVVSAAHVQPLKRELASHLTPLSAQDAYDLERTYGPEAALAGYLADLFGVGLQTYAAKQPKGGTGGSARLYGSPTSYGDATSYGDSSSYGGSTGSYGGSTGSYGGSTGSYGGSTGSYGG